MLAVFGMLAADSQARTEIYKPTRFAEKWIADTLFLGAAFRYEGSGPIRVSLLWSETITHGRLYAVNPATGETIHLMSNMDPQGTTVELSALTRYPAGGEVVFMYRPEFDNIPRYAGPGNVWNRFFNRITGNRNVNESMRFGRRWSVAGQIRPGVIEFGFEESPENLVVADRDFNDAHFQVEELTLALESGPALAGRRFGKTREQVARIQCVNL
jgi:hypothetical protein